MIDKTRKIMDLKPCPFCGGSAEWFDEVSGLRTIQYCIECNQCACQTTWSTCKDTIRQLWNSRTFTPVIYDFSGTSLDMKIILGKG
jgi:Lar family restriction alleviation protein